MQELLKNKLAGKKVLILGFGREGQSTFRLLRKTFPDLEISVADANTGLRDHSLLADDARVALILGDHYLDHLKDYSLIIKTPGITRKQIPELDPGVLTSQTDLFLQAYAPQIVGITGTKGKSTTSSLLYHILKHAERPAVLLGNIGRPAFDLVDEITPEKVVVYEMSSHQLETITRGPHIGVLLNYFQEHLDAYRSYREYRLAKWNITEKQQETDFFIYHADDDLILEQLQSSALQRKFRPFSLEHPVTDGSFVDDNRIFRSTGGQVFEFMDLARKRKLKGAHNVKNIMAVINCCTLLGLDDDLMREGIASFTGLEHRLEDVGTYRGIRFFNDSIATIPEACIEAVKALDVVDTLVLGGFDRGVDYAGLAVFLTSTGVRNFIFTGEAGKRIHAEMLRGDIGSKHMFQIARFDDFAEIAFRVTKPGGICLLSPAAASYDEFQNFEMRGKRFKELVSVE